MELNKDELLNDSFANSLSAMSCAFALRDVLLLTEEQKALYNTKQKEYIKKYFLEFAEKYKLENPEQFLENLLKTNQQ